MLGDSTNPKDLLGIKKVPLDLVPDTAIIHMAMAFKDGAKKYGPYNWREKKVSASIYAAAIARHKAQWYNGEDKDKISNVKHLASIMACCAILIDAEVCGNLIDDKPTKVDITDLLESLEEKTPH